MFIVDSETNVSTDKHFQKDLLEEEYAIQQKDQKQLFSSNRLLFVDLFQL